MLLEAQIEKAVVRYAEAHGWFVRKLGWVQRAGAPDRFFAHPSRAGRPVFIEFKRPGERPTRQQEVEHNRMRDAGLEVHVIDDIEMGKRVLGL